MLIPTVCGGQNWIPPKTTIDAKYVAAAKSFLGNALPDPKGGQFCEMSGPPIQLYMPPTKTYGWLRPGKKRIVLIDGTEVEASGTITAASLKNVLPRLEHDAQYGGPQRVGCVAPSFLPGMVVAKHKHPTVCAGKMHVTFCDELASEVAELWTPWTADVPEFKLMWSASKRAAALPKLIAWLSDDSVDWQKYMKSNVWWSFAKQQ